MSIKALRVFHKRRFPECGFPEHNFLIFQFSQLVLHFFPNFIFPIVLLIWLKIDQSISFYFNIIFMEFEFQEIVFGKTTFWKISFGKNS